MTSFNIILTVVIIAGGCLGYWLGAVRILMACAQIALAFIAAYFLFEPLAQWLVDHGTMQLLYAYTLSVSAILLASFISIALLARPLMPLFSSIHKNRVNQITGLLGVASTSAVACVIVIQLYTTVSLPQELSDELEQTGIATALDEQVQSITEKLVSLSSVQVMAVRQMDPVKKEGVTLSFSVDHYTLRPQLESDMLQLVNAERVKRGLRPLSYDSSLVKAARLHSADMLARGYFSHNTPEGTDPFQRLHQLDIHYRYAGENLALAPTLWQAHEGLMQSPGHKANILHPSYGRLGIAVLDAGVYGLMITQEFRD